MTRAHLIDASGTIHDLGDVDLSQSLAELRPDLAHLAPGSVLVTGTDDRAVLAEIAGPARMVSPAYEFTASIRRPVEPNNRWPSLKDVVHMPLSPPTWAWPAEGVTRYGWPDPDRGGARKRRRGWR